MLKYYADVYNTSYDDHPSPYPHEQRQTYSYQLYVVMFIYNWFVFYEY